MVVLGGGFAGVAAVRALARAPVEVALVDRWGRHVFQPLLARVALGDLEPGEVSVPLEALLHRQRNVRVVAAEAVGVDPARRTVALADGELSYDWLVVAAGGVPAYLGHVRWRALAPPLHTLEDALDIRARVRGALAAALSERDAIGRATWLTFVVVGAGPIGVELAGGLAELTAELPPGHPGRAARIVLVERGARPLPRYPDAVGRRAHRLLDQLGVEVRTRTAVAGVDGQGVRLPGERISARTVLWAAGLDAADVGGSLGAPLDGAGRLEVRPDLSVRGLARVFAAGDVAAVTDGEARVPGTAAAAIEAGRHAAENVLRELDGAGTRPFRFRPAGRLAAVGRSTFVGHVGPVELPPAVATLLARAAHARWLWPARAPVDEAAAPRLAGVRSA